MLDDVVPLLRCPLCRGALSRDGSALRCGERHAYDIARHGYVPLLAGRAPSGDTADMVAARQDFLAAGHYAWLADLIAQRIADCVAQQGVRGPVVDAGAGTGYHLRAVLERVPQAGLALDSSPYALRRAARAHPRIGAVRADLWRPLPVVDGVAGLVLNVFAPRNAGEFHRVLRSDGLVLTVTPTSGHLAELVGGLHLLSVDRDKGDRLVTTLGRHFAAGRSEEHRVTMRLDHREVAALVRMGPSARHLDMGELASRIAALPDPVDVTAACQLTLWRPLRTPHPDDDVRPDVTAGRKEG